MKIPLLKLCSVHTSDGQSSNVPSSSKSTTGSAPPNPKLDRSRVMNALVFMKVKLVAFRKEALRLMLRFARETFVELGTVTVGRMRMLPLEALNKVLVMLLSVLEASVESHTPLV